VSEVVAIYRGLCPNCHGEITDSRLRLRLPCNKCLPIIPSEFDGDLEDYLKIKKILEENGKLLYYEEFLEPILKNQSAFEFFKKATGKSLWSSQRLWVKRALSGRSFAITAPAGVGKSFFGEVMSLYLTIKDGKRCYIIVPTTPLVEQSYKRIQTYLKEIDEHPRVVFYHSELSNSKRKEVLDKIVRGDFDLLITTSQFLSKNFEKLKDKRFDFVFVDDVDSFFKYSRNIDRVLILLGFDREVINKAERLISLKRALISSKEKGKDILVSIKNLKDEIEYWKKEHRVGQIILSSATAKPRGMRIKLFKELLGFDLGVPSEGIRNIYDAYRMVPSGSDLCDYVYEIVNNLGDGGLVFVPKDLGIEEAERISNYLNEKGILAAAIHSGNKSLYLPEFIEGRIGVLVGVATQQGVIVRGIDLPWRVRYVVFAEVPRNKLVIESERILPNDILILLKILSEITEMDEIERAYRKLKLMYTSLSKEEREKLKESIVNDFPLRGKLEDLRKEFVERGKFCYELIRRPFIQRSLSDYQYARIEVEGSKLIIYFPDVASYIQASGRASRIYPGGISTGLSVILSYHKSMVNGIRRQLSLRYENLIFKPIDELNVDEIMVKIDKERDFIRKVYEGKIKELKIEDPIKSALLIVESPTKARTIASFFGKPSRVKYGNLELYEVTTGDYILGLIATKGHLFDLVSDEENYGVRFINESFVPVYDTIKRCSKCGHQFVDFDKCPKCGSEEFFDSIEIIKQLNNIANDFNMIFIASDPDTEGEKIAWDVKNVSFLSREKKRIELHEITRYALQKGMKTPRDVNINMVKAQIVRRVEDRWIGYELSKRLRMIFKNERLTAGRVQSAVLYWIIKRYSDRMKDLHYFLSISADKLNITIDYPNVKNRNDALKIRSKIEKSNIFVEDIEEKIEEVNPLPPYTTDSMLIDASNILKLNPSDTMKLAQDLFENGLITYHRTDSKRISQQGFRVAREYIVDHFGEGNYMPRQWGHGGAHECIRPVRPIDPHEIIDLIREGVLKLPNMTKDHIRLYSLIFRRFMASQMVPALVKKGILKLKILDKRVNIEGILEIMKEGFTKLYNFNLLKPIPNLRKGDTIELKEVKMFKSSNIRLYTEADIVSEMRKKNIGRPSTYSVIIKKLFDRGYVYKNKGAIIPTSIGTRVGNYLHTNYSHLVSEERTAELYKKMDKVENGELNYQNVLKETFREVFS